MLNGKKILLVGGPGGVGKTTLAAAVGVRLALQGKRVVVLTIDPAKRLAQAMGLNHFTSEIQRVPLEGAASGSELYASMLDTQRYFDKIITRFALNDSQREKILAHPFYKIMVENLGGTHEYAAMERLLEFSKSTEYDFVVVDTPPSQNAVDLLNAPQRLADFMDTSVLKWFQGSRPIAGLFRTGTKVAMKLLQKIFGSEFIEKLSEVLDHLDGMQAGFRQRHLEVLELLKSAETGFFLVTYPSEARYVESQNFLQSLKSHGISLTAIILNRVEPAVPSMESLGEKGEGKEVRAFVDYFSRLEGEQQKWIAQFQALFQPCLLIQRTANPIHTTERLSELAEKLI